MVLKFIPVAIALLLHVVEYFPLCAYRFIMDIKLSKGHMAVQEDSFDE